MTDTTTSRPLGPAANAAAGPSTTDLPLDVETADQAADDALKLRLGTTTRQEIDEWTAKLRGRISLFAEKTLGREQTTATRACRWEVDQLLAAAPRDSVLVFGAYQYLRDLARMLRRLVAEYKAQAVTAGPAHLSVRAPLDVLPHSTEDGRADLNRHCLAPEREAMPPKDGA
ncbi:hypothetical protein [Streptomyces sp. NBC_01217]|uniref:hypothetical protein n=1 Tax=Streptomyces sp. NBC_01217 TaxID=2903779 RepID=UPI002E156F4B|nr:hypothetical protein OG507_23670 [Streptomyces sp. NBC_01217]